MVQGGGTATATATTGQQPQIIQTSEGQTLVYPIQLDSQGNIIQQQQPTSKFLKAFFRLDLLMELVI